MYKISVESRTRGLFSLKYFCVCLMWCGQIADFGVSEQIDQSESQISRWAGTPAFLAPETLSE